MSEETKAPHPIHRLLTMMSVEATADVVFGCIEYMAHKVIEFAPPEEDKMVADAMDRSAAVIAALHSALMSDPIFAMKFMKLFSEAIKNTQKHSSIEVFKTIRKKHRIAGAQAQAEVDEMFKKPAS